MRIGWWAEVALTPHRFTFGTPTNHIPLIREAERRGHIVELIHVPPRMDGDWVLEAEDYERLRPKRAFDEAIMHRRLVEATIKEKSGLDATMRTFNALRELVDHREVCEPYDVVFMKLPPPGFMRAKVETVYHIWRFIRAGVPVFAFDGDHILEMVAEHLVDPNNRLHCRTPYRPKKTLPNWKHQPYFYDKTEELPIVQSYKKFDLVYVGNDWKAFDSPRVDGIRRFYGRGPDAIYGRWTEANQVATGVPRDMFYPPIESRLIQAAYREGYASVITGMPAQIKSGHMTQRYREIIQGGAIALVDGRFEHGDTAPMLYPRYRLDDYDDVKFWLDLAKSDWRAYVECVLEQRWYASTQWQLSVESWIDQLESIAGEETKT